MDDPEIIVSLYADIEGEFIHFTQEGLVSTVVHVYIGLVSYCPISDCGIVPDYGSVDTTFEFMLHFMLASF